MIFWNIIHRNKWFFLLFFLSSGFLHWNSCYSRLLRYFELSWNSCCRALSFSDRSVEKIDWNFSHVWIVISLQKQLGVRYTELTLTLIMRCLQLKFCVSCNKLSNLHTLSHIVTWAVVHSLNAKVRKTVARTHHRQFRPRCSLCDISCFLILMLIPNYLRW